MATTINAYNVSLGMDASKYLTNAGLSRSETVKLAQAIDQARSPAERYENALERLTKAKATGAIQTGTFIRLMDEEKRKLDAATASTEKHTSNIDKLTWQLKGLVAGYVGLQTLTKSVNLAVAAEQAAVKFEILTGSVNDARRMMKQVQDFAVISPVTLAGAQNAASMMLSFGIAAKDVQRNLKMIGDISGGNQERFDRLVYVFSQMSVAGRLMGQDLKQMVEAGFNPLKIMSDETGLSIEALRDKMEAGEISAQMVTDAFVRATSEGGRFHGMTERMAETMGGKLAIATANLDLALTNLGKSLGPLIISLTEGMDKGTSAVDRMSAAVGVWADGMGMVVAFTNDVFSGNAAWGSRDFLKNTETYMDMLEKRAIEIAKAKEKIATEFSAPDTAGLLHGPTFDKEIQAGIEKDNKLRIKRANDMMLDVADEENKRMEMQEKLSANALKHAEEYFKRERDNARRLRDDIAKGPTSIEAGSAEAAKYMAEQANAAIAASMGLDKAVPTEEELLVEAQRQSELLEKSQENEGRMVELLRGILEKKPEVGRIR